MSRSTESSGPTLQPLLGCTCGNRLRVPRLLECRSKRTRHTNCRQRGRRRPPPRGIPSTIDASTSGGEGRMRRRRRPPAGRCGGRRWTGWCRERTRPNQGSFCKYSIRSFTKATLSWIAISKPITIPFRGYIANVFSDILQKEPQSKIAIQTRGAFANIATVRRRNQASRAAREPVLAAAAPPSASACSVPPGVACLLTPPELWLWRSRRRQCRCRERFVVVEAWSRLGRSAHLQALPAPSTN